jgi:hypothetical protein
MAFHRPGARKPTAPMTKALKRVVRYHFRWMTLSGWASVVEVAVGSPIVRELAARAVKSLTAPE